MTWLVLGGLLAPAAARRALAAGKVPRIGVVFPGVQGPSGQAFEKALVGLGWVLGQTLHVEYRFARGDAARVPALVAELIRLPVDALLVSSDVIPVAAEATRTIPIVMTFAIDDPVERGWAASLAQPGGNITGITLYAPELTAKRLELLKTAVPPLRRVGVLAPGGVAGLGQVRAAEAAAHALGLQAQVAGVREVGDYEPAFQAFRREATQGVLVLSSSAFYTERRRLADLALQHRLPLVSPFREVSEAGGLLAYGPSVVELWAQRVPSYVDRILKGARPGALPIEQPSTFELVVNQRTARALGLAMPPSLLVGADKVIE